MIDVLEKSLKIKPCVNFETEIYKNTYWIPFTSLGPGNLTLEELVHLSNQDIQEKANKINTFLDMILLFIVSNFKTSDDTIKRAYQGLTWEFYKPGYLSVLTNTGCCATCCSWANFFLKKIYSDIGIIGILKPNSGHAINYIHTNGWYYIFDLQPLLNENIENLTYQSGLLKDFVKSKYITANFFKSKSLEDFAKFHNRFCSLKYPHLFYIKEEYCDCPPLSWEEINGKKCCYIPKVKGIKIIQWNISSNLFYSWVNLPEQNPYKIT